MRYIKLFGLFAAAMLLLLLITGCGDSMEEFFGGKKNDDSTRTLSISIAPSTSQVNAGGTVTLTVTTQNTDFTWPILTASQGALAPNGNQAIYTAPMVTANTTIEFAVTATADTTKKATARITIVALPVSIYIEPLTVEIISGETIDLTVIAQNTEFTWPTLSSEQGAFIIDENVAIYTAPMVTEDTIIEFTVTATADITKKATAEITVKLPSSVDDYSDFEPEMAENPNLAMARVGETTVIGIPDYLLPSSTAEISALALGDATFEVHEDDRDIAEIREQNGKICTVKGLKLGSARIIITMAVSGARATVILSVTPSEELYTLPVGDVRRLGNVTVSPLPGWWSERRPDSLPSDYGNYFTDLTYQLAWNWRNKGQSHGASGEDSGIDILAYFVDPGVNDRRGWVRTTFGFGGWHYDLNGQTNNMTDGVQVNGDVKLELIPEFIYDNGTPYLQITHKLTNTGGSRLTGQKFGASADIMIFNNDHAPLSNMPYGALMTNEYTSGGNRYLPTVKLRLIAQNMQGVDNVNTMWLGRYGSERSHVYDDQRESITAENNLDTALNFSYQGIDLNPGQSKNFVIRFTQVQQYTTSRRPIDSQDVLYNYDKKGWVTSGNGWNHPSTDYKGHLGVDYNFYNGSCADNAIPVSAIAMGTIIHSGRAGASNGHAVTIKHKNNGVEFYSFYAHLESGTLKGKGAVEANVEIGKMGNSGNVATNNSPCYGRHLHLAIYTVVNSEIETPTQDQCGYYRSTGNCSGRKEAFDDHGNGYIDFRGYRFYDPQKFFETNGGIIPGVVFK